MPADKEVIEQEAMKLVADRLTEAGLKVEIQWNRPDSNAFPDYKGSINGQPWAFEITQMMRPNPKGFKYIRSLDVLKVPSLDDLKNPSEDTLKNLEKSILPQVPTNLETLQDVLQERIREKSAPQRTRKLDQDEKYCLILIDNQFFYDEDWLYTIANQDYSVFDTVVAVHSHLPFGYESVCQEVEPPVTACPKIPPEWSQHIPNYKDISSS